jgi:hypothetical protein
VLLVGTGQNTLGGTPLLQRVQGRFPVTVELQDTDVEQVTRKVVLKKKLTAIPTVQRLLDTHSGEIEHHMASTSVAFNSRDRDLLVHDYPLLPARRRFWEHVSRAVDKSGTGAQLRTQLWIVYDAARRTADAPDALHDVVEILGIVLHSGMASRRTWSRRSGLKAFSVTTSTSRPKRSSRSRVRPAGNQELVVGPASRTLLW